MDRLSLGTPFSQPPPLKRGKSVAFMKVGGVVAAPTVLSPSPAAAAAGGHLALPSMPIKSSSSPPSPSSRNASLVTPEVAQVSNK